MKVRIINITIYKIEYVMITTFHLSSEELNDEFLKKIRQSFGKKQLLITVEEDTDDTFFLLSTKENRQKLNQSIRELERGEVVSFTAEDLRK